MTTLLAYVLAGIAHLDPNAAHPEIADAIAHVVEDEPPLFRDDDSKQKTASLVLAVAFREGSLGLRVIGDCDKHTAKGVCISGPRSFCTMQVHQSMGGSDALNEDPELCIRAGLRILRSSVRACPSSPVAIYASGPNGCGNARAQRISRDRLALAARIHAAAIISMAKEDS